MWSMIWQKLKEIIRRMIGNNTIEQTLHVKPVISSEMASAVELWKAMYEDHAPWLHEPTWDDPTRVASMGLPALIASEKARTALLEFKSDITTPSEEVEIRNPEYKDPEQDVLGNIIPSAQPEFIKVDKPVSDTTRAEYLNNQYHQKLLKHLRREFEFATALGGFCIKPYVVRSKTMTGEDRVEIEIDFVSADNFYPLAFSSNGKIPEAVFVQTRASQDVTYRRLEYHKWENNTVTIINRAFKSTAGTNNAVDLGQEVPLTEVPEWAELQREVTIENVTRPLFAYFKMPDANIIDMHSPLGVSGFARAVNLIKDADIQYSRLLWEYEGGELAIDIDRDALRTEVDSHGNDHTVLNNLQRRLYRKVDLGTTDDTYEPYAPNLRDDSYTKGLNTILMRVEDACGLSRGTLAEVYTAEARTATELKILKQRSFQANAEIQNALEDTLRDVIYIMNVFCDLYEITPDGEYDISFEWDDSIIVDRDTELLNRITLQQNGLTSKRENRMWYFGETERQADEALLLIKEEQREAMEDEMIQTANEINLSQPEETQETPSVQKATE